MGFNINNLFSSFSSGVSSLFGRTSDKNNASFTPPFSPLNNNQQNDNLFRRLAMNYAPPSQQETTSIRNVEVPTKLNSDGTFTAAISRKELGIKGKWQAVDPHKVSELAYKKAVIALGIATDETEAKTIAQKAHSGGITMKYGSRVRPVKETDFADRAFINQSVDKLSNYILTTPKDQVEAIYKAAESVVGKERADAARLKNGFPVVTQKTESDMALAGGAGLMFRLPPPIVFGGILVGSTIYTTTQMHETMRNNHLSGERTNSLPLPFEMNAEPNFPQGVPPLQYPPAPPPLPGRVDESDRVKTVTQTTTPIEQPRVVTQTPPRSNQTLPPTPPFINPIQEQDKLSQIIMATYPGATTEESVRLKLENYLLELNHPIGGPKAKWYEQALGFTKSNMDELARQLVFDPAKAVPSELTPYGQKYEQLTLITGANGKKIEVTVVWITNPDGITRIVTAPPANK